MSRSATLGAIIALSMIGCSSELDSSSQDIQEGSTGAGASSGSGGSSQTTHASVKVDGVEMTVTEIALLSPSADDPDFHVFVGFDGPGMPAGSDFHLVVGAVGVGCDAANEMWLRPSVDSTVYPDQFTSDNAGCGLEVTSVPAAPGEALTARIDGTLDALQSWTQPRTAAISAAVTVIWEETSSGTGGGAPPSRDCIDDGMCTIGENCVCGDCDSDPFCSDPSACLNDGVCSPYDEGCVCADCASHPQCTN